MHAVLLPNYISTVHSHHTYTQPSHSVSRWLLSTWKAAMLTCRSARGKTARDESTCVTRVDHGGHSVISVSLAELDKRHLQDAQTGTCLEEEPLASEL